MITLLNNSNEYIYLIEIKQSIPPMGEINIENINDNLRIQIQSLVSSGVLSIISKENHGFLEKKYNNISKSIDKINPLLYKIGIVIPCHNYAHFLDDAIMSCYNQTKMPSEIVVVNDSSTDNTREIAQKYKIKYIEVYYKNLGKTRNTGLDLLSDNIDLVIFLDADNKLHDKYSLEKFILPFSDQSVGVVHSNLMLIDQNGNQVNKYDKVHKLDYWKLRKSNHIDAFAMVRKDIVNMYRWEECEVNGFEDWLLWIKISQSRWKFYFIDDCLGDYRIHNSNMLKNIGKNHIKIQSQLLPRTATIAMVTPFVGRDYSLEIYQDTLNNIDNKFKNMTLIVSDSSSDINFKNKLINLLSKYEYKFEYIPIHRKAINSSNNEDFSNSQKLRVINNNNVKLAEQMAFIYSECLSHNRFDYIVTLEDDVSPPKNWLDIMLEEMLAYDADVVAARVRNRWRDHYPLLCWKCTSVEPFEQDNVFDDSIYIDGSHFACTMFLGNCFEDLGIGACPSREGRYAGADIAHSFGLYLQGKKRILSKVDCKHYNNDGTYV